MHVYTLSDMRSEKKLRVYTASEAKGLRVVFNTTPDCIKAYLLSRADTTDEALVFKACTIAVCLYNSFLTSTYSHSSILQIETKQKSLGIFSDFISIQTNCVWRHSPTIKAKVCNGV